MESGDPVIALALAVLFQTVFAQSYKAAVVRGQDVVHVNSASLVISMAAVLYPALGSSLEVAPLLLGLAKGVIGFISARAFFQALRYGSLSTSWTVICLAALGPVVFGLLLWGEGLRLLQWGAIFLLVASVVLMGDVEIRQIQSPRSWLLWLSLSYLASALGLTTLKALEEWGAGHGRALFLCTGYVTASVCAIWDSWKRPRWPNRAEWLAGGVRGLSRIASNLLLLLALSQVSSVIAFPFYSIAQVLLTTISSILLWKERLTLRSGLGMGLALIVIGVLST
jgi:drug/metabolite transporter (DMT)-like permease